MTADYVMYAWECSHFSAKLRGFLNHKRVTYEEKTCTLYDLLRTIPRNTGVRAMPVLRGRGGQWLVDTPEIMAQLERLHSERACIAATPRQDMLAQLFENWFDDGLMAVSLRTRWAYPENWDTLLRDASARDLLPGVPLFISRRVATKVFKSSMSRAQTVVGLRPGGQEEQLEAWALKLFDLLEVHFAAHDYLFGGHPSVADFALLGCLAAHVNRDPWPRREWMAARPVLAAWSDRLHNGEGGHGDLLPDDAIAPTLEPLVAMMLDEMPVLLSESAAAIEDVVKAENLTSGAGLPRTLRDVTARLGGRDYIRNPFSYTVWRMQRIQTAFGALDTKAQASVRALLKPHGHADLMAQRFGPPLERAGLGTRLARA